MFKLTDSKALRMAESLARLQKDGCDVEMLLSQSYGALVLASSVKKVLNKAKVKFRCSAIPMHTKMILIGPSTGNEDACWSAPPTCRPRRCATATSTCSPSTPGAPR